MEDRETMSLTLDQVVGSQRTQSQRAAARGVRDAIEAERSNARRRKGKEAARLEDDGVLDVDSEDEMPHLMAAGGGRVSAGGRRALSSVGALPVAFAAAPTHMSPAPVLLLLLITAARQRRRQRGGDGDGRRVAVQGPEPAPALAAPCRPAHHAQPRHPSRPRRLRRRRQRVGRGEREERRWRATPAPAPQPARGVGEPRAGLGSPARRQRGAHLP